MFVPSNVVRCLCQVKFRFLPPPITDLVFGELLECHLLADRSTAHNLCTVLYSKDITGSRANGEDVLVNIYLRSWRMLVKRQDLGPGVEWVYFGNMDTPDIPA
jgi:hypothetical protein